MSKLKIAVIGVGYLGHYHALKYSQLDNVDLVSVVDTDHEKAAKLATKLKVQAETDYILLHALSILCGVQKYVELKGKNTTGKQYQCAREFWL